MLQRRLTGQTRGVVCTGGLSQCQTLVANEGLKSLQVKKYGGAATVDITASTTHVVVVPAAASSTPEAGTGQLLGQLLREHGGLPALKTLHRRLHSQQAHVVTQRLAPQLPCLAF